MFHGNLISACGKELDISQDGIDHMCAKKKAQKNLVASTLRPNRTTSKRCINSKLKPPTPSTALPISLDEYATT